MSSEARPETLQAVSIPQSVLFDLSKYLSSQRPISLVLQLVITLVMLPVFFLSSWNDQRAWLVRALNKDWWNVIKIYRNLIFESILLDWHRNSCNRFQVKTTSLLEVGRCFKRWELDCPIGISVHQASRFTRLSILLSFYHCTCLFLCTVNLMDLLGQIYHHNIAGNCTLAQSTVLIVEMLSRIVFMIQPVNISVIPTCMKFTSSVDL